MNAINEIKNFPRRGYECFNTSVLNCYVMEGVDISASDMYYFNKAKMCTAFIDDIVSVKMYTYNEENYMDFFKSDFKDNNKYKVVYVRADELGYSPELNSNVIGYGHAINILDANDEGVYYADGYVTRIDGEVHSGFITYDMLQSAWSKENFRCFDLEFIKNDIDEKTIKNVAKEMFVTELANMHEAYINGEADGYGLYDYKSFLDKVHEANYVDMYEANSFLAGSKVVGFLTLKNYILERLLDISIEVAQEYNYFINRWNHYMLLVRKYCISNKIDKLDKLYGDICELTKAEDEFMVKAEKIISMREPTFFNFRVTGNYVWNHIEFSNEQVVAQIEDMKKTLGRYAMGDFPIALYLSRGPKALCCMTALLELGIPFVNIDKAIPQNRREYMLNSIGVKYLIADEDIDEENVCVLSVDDIIGKEGCNEEIEKPSKYAYYLFTSGTTGNPKAVPILRESLANFFDGINERIPFSEGQRILNLTSYSFDIVFLETLYAIYNGLTVVIADEEQVNNTKAAALLIEEEHVDAVQMTPSRLKLFALIDKSLGCLKRVSIVMIGGEAFPIESLELLQKNTSARIFNMYGPTETTIWSAISDLTDKNEIDIGTPIVNTGIFILDDNLTMVDEGVEGEICISGNGLSTGYVNNAEATCKAFVKAYIEGKEMLVYRTGDIGKVSENGTFYCFGRIDTQIKYNGHRIELDDIDKNVESLNLVERSATCFNKEGNTFVTYYVAANDVDSSKFIEGLEKKLPDYMIPRKYIRVDDFIYTISGKLDRNKMMEIEETKERADTENEENTPFSKIAAILQSKGIESFTEDSIVKEVIPDSVMFMEILIAIEDEFDFQFDMSKLSMNDYERLSDILRVVEQSVC